MRSPISSGVNSPEVYLLQVRESERSTEDYQRWPAATLELCLVPSHRADYLFRYPHKRTQAG